MFTWQHHLQLQSWCFSLAQVNLLTLFIETWLTEVCVFHYWSAAASCIFHFWISPTVLEQAKLFTEQPSGRLRTSSLWVVSFPPEVDPTSVVICEVSQYSVWASWAAVRCVEGEEDRLSTQPWGGLVLSARVEERSGKTSNNDHMVSFIPKPYCKSEQVNDSEVLYRSCLSHQL